MQKASRDLSKGMVKQPNPLFNPESAYYFALNAIQKMFKLVSLIHSLYTATRAVY